MVMNAKKSINFLKPQLFNVLLTFLILCLPFLREQYNNGQFVTYHRPIVVMIDYFREPRQPEILLIILIFTFIIYGLASLAILGVKKYILPKLKS